METNHKKQPADLLLDLFTTFDSTDIMEAEFETTTGQKMNVTGTFRLVRAQFGVRDVTLTISFTPSVLTNRPTLGDTDVTLPLDDALRAAVEAAKLPKHLSDDLTPLRSVVDEYLTAQRVRKLNLLLAE